MKVWGYRGDEAKCFELDEGETLPPGWYNSAEKARSRAGEMPRPFDPGARLSRVEISDESTVQIADKPHRGRGKHK